MFRSLDMQNLLENYALKISEQPVHKVGTTYLSTYY